MVDGLKEAPSGLVELLSGLIIAQFAGALVELLEGDAGGEVAGGIGQRLELLVRGHDVLVPILFSHSAFVVDGLGGEPAGAVEVQVGGQHVLSEVIDFGGESRGDMGVAEVFSHHRAVLALGQGVVVGTPGPRAGELPMCSLLSSRAT